MSALETQVGGSHYKDMPIQPLEYCIKNQLGFAEGAVVKYVSRWRQKGGVEDLKKARHFLDVLIEMSEVESPLVQLSEIKEWPNGKVVNTPIGIGRVVEVSGEFVSVNVGGNVRTFDSSSLAGLERCT